MSIVFLREMATSVSGSVFSYSGCLAKGAVSSPQNGSKFKLQVRDFVELRVIFSGSLFRWRGKIFNCDFVVLFFLEVFGKVLKK